MNTTPIKREIIAGMTTLLSSIYITMTIPMMLQTIGIPPSTSFVTTCLIIGLTTCCVGLYSKRPIMAGPGLALTTYVTTELVGHLHYDLSQTMAMVLIAGLALSGLARMGVVKHIESALSQTMLTATSVGIGCFFFLISLKMVFVHHLPSFSHAELGWAITLCVFIGLKRTGVPGYILLGLIMMACGEHLFFSETLQPLALSQSITTWHWLKPSWHGLFHLKSLMALVTLILVCLMDTIATMHALLDQHPTIAADRDTATRVVTTLGLSSAASSLCANAPISIYLESAAGVMAGGRTWLTSVSTGIGFMCCMALQPLLTWVPQWAIAATLSFIACHMMASGRHLPWKNPSKMTAAWVIILTLPATMSIAMGVGAGLIAETLEKCHRKAPVSRTLAMLCIMFVALFASMLIWPLT